MWQCKVCGTELSSRYELLKHSKLIHGHLGTRFRHPCVYSSCPCTFKSWNNLLSHIYRAHCDQSSSKQDQLATFSCQLCACIESNQRDYFCHLNEHLRKHETVTCVFKECTFKSNIYNTFHTHKNRKHNLHGLTDFKLDVVTVTADCQESASSPVELTACSTESLESCSDVNNDEDISKASVLNIALVLLKLENILHVPATAVDELLQELHYSLTSASNQGTCCIISDILRNHNLEIGESVIQELSEAVGRSNPLVKAIEIGGPLATAFKRKQFYKEHVRVVEPIEFILDQKSRKTYQYIPILPSLQQLFSCSDILKCVTGDNERHKTYSGVEKEQQYKSIRDGLYCKENSFFLWRGIENIFVIVH